MNEPLSPFNERLSGVAGSANVAGKTNESLLSVGEELSDVDESVAANYAVDESSSLTEKFANEECRLGANAESVSQTRETSSQMVPDPSTPGAYLVRVNNIDQSWVSAAHPERLEFDYMQLIGNHIDAHAPAGERLRVVHVGGAGMSLARYVAASRPTSAQIVLEPDATLTALVRSIVPLPRNSGIKVRAIDGLEGVAAMPNDYADIVILDAFAAGQVPAELVTTEYFVNISRILRSNGVLLTNLVDDQQLKWVRRVLAGMAQVFSYVCLQAEPAILKGRRFGNMIAGASLTELPLGELSRRIRSAAFPHTLLWGETLRHFVGNALPFSVNDAAPSPSCQNWPTWI
ncbi:MAG: fused MFS/spermidine synthase [Propionibacteriaceae bacterium]|jgi:spermidine synthase|nr:fused MFS/spermidine synthase [Propionibacteriaceae bacterium]